MKLKALKELLINKLYSKYIPSSALENTEVEEIILKELEKLFIENKMDEKVLGAVD